MVLPKTCEDYALRAVYGEMDANLANEILAFWMTNDAIKDPQEARRRVAEVACVARNAEREIVGVNSVYQGTLGESARPYYFYRIFIGKRDRVLGLAGRMRKVCLGLLRTIAAGNGVVGLAMVAENAKYMTLASRRQLSRSGWQYVGREALGRDVWKIDFDGSN